MKDISCRVVEDLIPLVKDSIASDESIKLVTNHIKECESCKELFEQLDMATQDDIAVGDKKIVASIKRRIFLSQLIVLVVGTILGVVLTNTMGMFYNFTILPFIGALAYISLRDRWYLVPISIMALVYLWQILEFVVKKKFVWEILYGSLILTGIYGSLVVLGVIIGFLLKFAFERGDGNYER